MTERESELWEAMWSTPQAILWEQRHVVEFVALFVRQLAEAEVEKASAENRKTVRMLFADLWLTPDSMARARIRITNEAEPVQAPAPRRSARDRLNVINFPERSEGN